MHVPMRSFRKPVTDQLRLMRGRLVHDDMDFKSCRHICFDGVEEFAELLSAMTGKATPDHLIDCDVKGGEERGCAVAHIIVGAPLHLARTHRQKRLGTIERLDLALLVNAKDDRALRRIEVEPDDIAPSR